MARNHFKKSRVCSSDNYELSKRIHVQYIKEEHCKNVTYIEKFVEANYVKKAYIKCFGKLVPITLEEVHKVERSLTIIWK